MSTNGGPRRAGMNSHASGKKRVVVEVSHLALSNVKNSCAALDRMRLQCKYDPNIFTSLPRLVRLFLVREFAHAKAASTNRYRK